MCAARTVALEKKASAAERVQGGKTMNQSRASMRQQPLLQRKLTGVGTAVSAVPCAVEDA